MVTFTVTGVSSVQVHWATSAKAFLICVKRVISVGHVPLCGPVGTVGIVASILQLVATGLVKVNVKSDWLVCANATVGCVVMMMFASHCLTVSKLAVMEVAKSTI
jgi:hypothetical protein